MIAKKKSWHNRINNFINNHYFPFWICVFLVCRSYVIFSPPPTYSDVTHYYERYANIWHYGLPPYSKSVFEYGPLAAIAIYLPLRLDLAGFGYYYLNYRLLSVIFDALLFVGLLNFAKEKKTKHNAGLALYVILTTISHHWLYEGIDMIFTSFAITSLLLLGSREKKWRTLSQVCLWASTAVKFLTLPLIWPWYLLSREKWHKSILRFCLTFLLVWGAPLVVYRSSLSVPFIYNAGRTIKYNTLAHLLIRTANYFQPTDIASDQAPDYSYNGPKSQLATNIVTWLYPLSLLGVLLLSSWVIFRAERPRPSLAWRNYWQQLGQPSTLTNQSRLQLAAKIYLFYFVTSFLTAKIYSNPFLIWIMPLVVILDITEKKSRQTFYWLISAWTILELTSWLSANTWHLTELPGHDFEAFEIAYGWTKWSIVLGMWSWSFKQLLPKQSKSKLALDKNPIM